MIDCGVARRAGHRHLPRGCHSYPRGGRERRVRPFPQAAPPEECEGVVAQPRPRRERLELLGVPAPENHVVGFEHRDEAAQDLLDPPLPLLSPLPLQPPHPGVVLERVLAVVSASAVAPRSAEGRFRPDQHGVRHTQERPDAHDARGRTDVRLQPRHVRDRSGLAIVDVVAVACRAGAAALFPGGRVRDRVPRPALPPPTRSLPRGSGALPHPGRTHRVAVASRTCAGLAPLLEPHRVDHRLSRGAANPVRGTAGPADEGLKSTRIRAALGGRRYSGGGQHAPVTFDSCRGEKMTVG
jgi:hypothetical protein